MASSAMSIHVPEQETNVDANTLLSELDKGLRSTRPGEQCEAIVSFPWLFERYPFPILINSACLKLAEVFRNGSNFSRLLVLKVIKQSEKHLDKIFNVDEFVRRLFAVSYSNDPVARGITLRALGAIAGIVSERKSIHHCVRDSLDSHDEIEIAAAIEAAAALSYKSAEFALNIYPKVLKMINGLATPLEAKVRLLSVLHHSHYNSKVAQEVRDQCVHFLPSYPSEKFVCAALHTLSYISSTSLTQIPVQIDLLLNYFKHDARMIVKRSVLRELTLLAQSSPHLWTKSNVQKLIDCVEQAPKSPQKSKKRSQLVNYNTSIVFVLSQLVKCTALLADEREYLTHFNDKVVKICLNVIYGHEHNAKLVSTCIQLLTSLCIYGAGGKGPILEETVCALQAYILMIRFSAEEDQTDKKIELAFVQTCKSVVQLCSIEGVGQTLASSFRFVLMAENLPSFCVTSICETLSAIGHETTDTEDLDQDLIKLINLYVSKVNISQENSSIEVTITSLFALYFQTLRAREQVCTIDLVKYLDKTSHWTCYRVLRQALRYGHHEAAANLSRKLCESSSSEMTYFWAQCLSKLSTAEKMLTADASSLNLDQAVSLYVEAASALKASVTPSISLSFQADYITLRYKLLQGHAQFRESCKLVRTAPAPAIAASIAHSSRDDLLKCGLVVVQMRKCAREFRTLADQYSALFQSSFNADNQTLSHIQLLQNSCTIIAEAIECIFQTNRVSALFVSKATAHLDQNKFDAGSSSRTAVEHKQLSDTCHRISELVSTELLATNNSSSLDCAQISLLQSISTDLVRVPLCFPRLFFQSIQTTCIKLALSPQPKSGDLLLINSSASFVLKVEGVVVQNSKNQVRKVSKVMINVTSSVISKSNMNPMLEMLNPKADNNAGSNLNLMTVPHNDYFQGQFLLAFSCAGLHTISVEASIIDENEAQWKTGPIQTTSVKVVEC